MMVPPLSAYLRDSQLDEIITGERELYGLNLCWVYPPEALEVGVWKE